MKKALKYVLLVLVLLLVVSGVAAAVMKSMQNENQSPAPLMQQKRAQLDTVKQLNSTDDQFSQTFNPAVREATLRDSGREGVGLFIKNVYFRVAGDIAFDTQELSALLLPRNPSEPVVLDDPTSFMFRPLNGSVTLKPEGLAALFNQYLIDYPEAQIRNIKVSTNPGELIVEGEASKIPGVWLPFTLTGPVELQDGHYFVYRPENIEVMDMEAKGLLNLVGLELQTVLAIDSSGAEFAGNNVVLDLNHALPPPEQDVNVASMEIDDQGVHLNITSEYDPEFPEPIVRSDSYISIQGGDVKLQRALVTDARLQLVAEDGGRLDGSLYSYRQQLFTGQADATPAGGITIYLGPYQPADFLRPALNDAQEEQAENDTGENNNAS